MTHQGSEPEPECENVNDCALHDVLRRDRRHSHVGDMSPAAVEDVPSNLARCLRKRAKSKPLTLQRRKKEHSAANAAYAKTRNRLLASALLFEIF